MKTSKSQPSKFLNEGIISVIEELKVNDPLRFTNLFFSQPEINTPPAEKIGWLKSEKALSLLFLLLTDARIISCQWESFQSHFRGQKNIEGKIKWQSELTKLVYLFQRLRDEEIIALHRTPHKQLKEHFLDKYNQPLNSGSIRTLLERGIKEDGREIMEDIIQKIISC